MATLDSNLPMSNSQDNETPEESQDSYPNAGRASGYTDEQGRAIGEDLVNRVTALMVAPQTKLVQLASQLDATIKVQDQRFHYILQQFQSYLEKEDQRHAAYDQSEQGTLAVLASIQQRLDQQVDLVQQLITMQRESNATANEALTVAKADAARLGKITKDVVILKKAMSESQLDRADLRTRIDSISTAQAVFTASMLLSARAVIVIDAEQVIVSTNRKALELFGYSGDAELIDQRLDILLPVRFRAAHRRHIEAFAASAETERLMADRHEVYGLHRDGTEFLIRAAIVKVPGGFTAVVERTGDG
jgi:PAS domain S-box-containing protein